MALMEAVLQRVNDQEPVILRMERSPALKELVYDYQCLTYDDASLPLISSVTTGLELKIAIGGLKPELQLALLKKYSDTIHGVPPVEPPAVAEERKNRHWFMKLFGVVASSILLILITTMVSVMLRGDKALDAGVMSSVLATTVEIIKLIFGGLK